MQELRPAPPEVLTVIDKLIAEHFPQLATARLAVLVREHAADIGGGRASVAATGIAGPGAPVPFEYVIWFALEVWRGLDEGDREAIAFHELTHCARDEAGRPMLKEHDAGVFTQEVELYGVWWKDAQKRFDALNDSPEREEGMSEMSKTTTRVREQQAGAMNGMADPHLRPGQDFHIVNLGGGNVIALCPACYAAAKESILGDAQGAASGEGQVNWNSVNWNSVNWNSVNWNSVNWNSVNWNS